MNRIASFWSETSPSSRWVTYVSVPLGTCMAVLGLIGDSHGWWENRSFLTNLLSSTTSVLFGIPTALIVLGPAASCPHVVGRQTETRRCDRPNRPGSGMSPAQWEIRADSESPSASGKLTARCRRARRRDSGQLAYTPDHAPQGGTQLGQALPRAAVLARS